MQRLIVMALAVGVGLSAAACEEEGPRGELREEQAEAAEERREAMDEIREEYAELREDYRELNEKMQELPPEQRQRLHAEMHREMRRDTFGAMPLHPPGAAPGMHQPRGRAPDTGVAPGASPDTTPPDTGAALR